MTLKTTPAENFIYITYRHRDFQGFDLFRKTIEEFVQSHGIPCDLIIDLSRSESITEADVALLTAVMRKLQLTTRHLRILARQPVLHKLRQMNLDMSGNLSLYASHGALIASMKPAAAK